MAPLRAAVLVAFALFAMASACGTSIVTSTGGSSGAAGAGGSGAGGGTCAANGELCTNTYCAETGLPDTSVAPTCCHGMCVVCAAVGDDATGICLDAPYCCPDGQPCHDNATCCSGACVDQEPGLIGGPLGTCATPTADAGSDG